MKKFLTTPIVVIIIFILLGSGVGIASIFFGGGSVNLQKGLVGHWKMDGNAKDSTPNGNHGTLVGNAAVTANDRKGQANKALALDGTGDAVTVGTNAIFNFTSEDFTISSWVYRNTGGTGGRQIFERHGWNATGYRLQVIQNTGEVDFYTFQSGANQITVATAAISADTWHHLLIIRQGATVTIYVDGVDATTTPGTHIDPVSYPEDTANISSAGESFNGSIDDVRIYNRVLSPAEITSLYDSYNPGIVVSDLQKGLVGQWKMDGNAKDSTPNSNHGTVTGATLTTDRKGQSSKAYLFDGGGDQNDYIDLGDPSAIEFGANQDFTISIWLDIDPHSVSFPESYEQVLLVKGTRDGTYDLMLSVNNNDSGTLKAMSDAWTGLLGSSALASGGWHNLVVVVDADGNTTAYVDTVAGTPVVSIGGTLSSTNTWKIGSATYSPDGSIDDVRFYNRVLSTTEITALYESYNPGIVVSDLQKGLVGHWKFDGNAKDATPNGNHGTVTGATLTTDRKGQSNKAYDFDGGATTNISIADSNSLDLTTAVTVSVWVNIPAAATGGIVSKGGAFGNTPCGPFTLGIITTSMYWEVGDGVNHPAISSANYPLGVWTHWVGVYNGSTLSLYKNGVLVTGPTDTVVTSMVVNTTNLLLADSLGTLGNLNTSLDDVRVYNRALSVPEVLELYNGYQ